ncbi:probable G-protein coupled receptor 141 [Hemitrygon akajei]|uniref:probable G-protein coupled receptor 141 n=1 Tax=Hemitrygon akajei TaxID=2704970 RepID=UPI003BF9B2E7
MADITTNNTSSSKNMCEYLQNSSQSILIAIYVLVLMGGSAGAFMMIWKIKNDKKSVTSIAVINLISVHTIFILTLPFRISYYVLDKWKFSKIFCKVVSAMIHVHLYLCFVFYVIIVVIRMSCFFGGKKSMQFYQPWHSSAVSLAIWALVLLAILPLFFKFYGASKEYNKTECFQFQEEFSEDFVKTVNYILITVVLTTICILLAIQMRIIIKLAAKHTRTLHKRQEFGAQKKTLLILFLMITCFLPYLGYRLYYIQQDKPCYIINEIFLALTTMSCFDGLIFFFTAH